MSNARTKAYMAPVAGTAVATTSGTSVDFTGIPSWAKRITVVFRGVSSNGVSAFNVQVGSGSVTTTGYSSGLWSGSATTLIASTGFIASPSVAASTYTGTMTLTQLGSNTWVASCVSTTLDAANIGCQSIGTVTLSGALDRVRFTTFTGTDTFDAGSVNILYE